MGLYVMLNGVHVEAMEVHLLNKYIIFFVVLSLLLHFIIWWRKMLIYSYHFMFSLCHYTFVVPKLHYLYYTFDICSMKSVKC